MKLDYYLKKNHIFKKRFNSFVKDNIFVNFNKFIYLFSSKKQRFEFIYLRVFKKLLRRKFCKAKMRFKKPKIWLYFKVNYVLTKKSKNARMGAGVGKLVRVTSILKKNIVFLKLKYFKLLPLLKIINFIKFKCSLSIYLRSLKRV